MPKAKKQKVKRALVIGFIDFIMNYLNFRLLRNGETTAKAKGLPRNFQSWGSLLAVLFAALDHANHVAHHPNFIATISGNLLRGAVIFHVILQNVVQDFVR